MGYTWGGKSVPAQGQGTRPGQHPSIGSGEPNAHVLTRSRLALTVRNLRGFSASLIPTVALVRQVRHMQMHLGYSVRSFPSVRTGITSAWGHNTCEAVLVWLSPYQVSEIMSFVDTLMVNAHISSSFLAAAVFSARADVSGSHEPHDGDTQDRRAAPISNRGQVRCYRQERELESHYADSAAGCCPKLRGSGGSKPAECWFQLPCPHDIRVYCGSEGRRWHFRAWHWGWQESSGASRRQVP